MGENVMTRWAWSEGGGVEGSAQPHGLSALCPLNPFRKKQNFEDEQSGETSNPVFWHANPARRATTTCSTPYRAPKPTKSLTNDHAGSVSGSSASSNDGGRPASVHFYFILGPASPRDALRRRAPNQSVPLLVAAWAGLWYWWCGVRVFPFPLLSSVTQPSTRNRDRTREMVATPSTPLRLTSM